MHAIGNFLKISRRGGSVYLHEVKAAFSGEASGITLVLYLLEGSAHVFEIKLPIPQTAEEEHFVEEYFYARVYNILSMLGGVKMDVYTGGEAYCGSLAQRLSEVFGVEEERVLRRGYAKCLNVADRMNIALHAAPFRFALHEGAAPMGNQEKESKRGDILAGLRGAVERSMRGAFVGIDVGGTDIKLIAARDGRIDHMREYDWNPSSFETVDEISSVVLLLARMSRALLSFDTLPQEACALREAVLKKGAAAEAIEEGVLRLEALAEKLTELDGMGVSFPDVVVRDKIVGGETHKTKGVREHASDYEKEFAKLSILNQGLAAYCKKEGSVHITNDGPMSAYAAAAELAHSPEAASVTEGIFAHSLGTELGAGWINGEGKVPEYPLEVYNCIIDLGNAPARSFLPADVRSLNNFNTGLPGTLQRFAGQSGAFRLAEEYYRKSAPARYQELFELGFILRTGEGMEAAIEPVDRRKAFLEHLMAQAEAGVEEAMEIFKTIGKCMAAVWLETDSTLHPACKSRVLFGRFVKRRAVFALMNEGAKEICPDILMFPADDELAYTELMVQLRDSKQYTVAQFGQAVGAIYFAASVLQGA